MINKTKLKYAITDRNRMISFIMNRMYAELILRRDKLFEPFETEPEPGDLVYMDSAPNDMWRVSWYEGSCQYGNYILRAMGTGELCKYSNISLMVFNRAFLEYDELLEGWKRRAFEKTSKALAQCDAYTYRYGGCQFEGSTLRYRIRPHCWVSPTSNEDKSFIVEIPHADKLTIKRAKQILLNDGVGKRW